MEFKTGETLAPKEEESSVIPSLTGGRAGLLRFDLFNLFLIRYISYPYLWNRFSYPPMVVPNDRATNPVLSDVTSPD